MKNRVLTPMTAALVLAGSLFTAEADDRHKTNDPRKARYLAAQRELSAAVKAGKLSEADAKKKLAAIKAAMSGHGKPAHGKEHAHKAQGNERMAKYKAIEREIYGALKAGKISEAEAKKKLAIVKKSLSGQAHGKPAHGKEHAHKAQGNERMAKYKAIEREIYGAVKAGKMSKDDAMKKLAHVKRELLGQAGQSDRAPRESQRRPDHHRKPVTSDKRGSDRNLAAEVDALRREIHELKRTLEAIRRHHGDRRKR